MEWICPILHVDSIPFQTAALDNPQYNVLQDMATRHLCIPIIQGLPGLVEAILEAPLQDGTSSGTTIITILIPILTEHEYLF